MVERLDHSLYSCLLGFMRRPYTTLMTSPEIPSLPTTLIDAGQRWASERAYADETVPNKELLRKLYLVGVVLRQAHRNVVRQRIEAGGGIKRVSSTLMEHINYTELQDGSLVYAADFLQAPTIKLGKITGVTPDTDRTYTQAHHLELAFGGPLLGGKAERSRNAINEQPFYSVDIHKLLEDEGFFPEEFAITESITTRFNQPAPDDDRPRDHVDKGSYSLNGKIWGVNPFNMNPSPDPFTQPLQYREWALRTHTKIDLSFQAPVTNPTNPRQIDTITVIDKYGSMKPDARTAITALGRFRALMGYYSYATYPHLFPQGDDVFSAIETTHSSQEE